MDHKDSTPQEDIIELIDIIEESEGSTSSVPKKEEVSGDADDLEDLFLFPGAADNGHSLLDELEDKERGADDDFPELDAIFEDLESGPDTAPRNEEPKSRPELSPEPRDLEARVAAVEGTVKTLADVETVRREIGIATEGMLSDVGTEAVQSRFSALLEQVPTTEQIRDIAETAARAVLESGSDAQGERKVGELIASTVREATEPWASLLEEQAGELEKIKQVLDSARTSEPTRAGVAEMVEEAVQERVAEQAARIADLEEEVRSLRRELQAREDEGGPDAETLRREMHAHIEKAVPAAAARIIREEIAGLLKAGA